MVQIDAAWLEVEGPEVLRMLVAEWEETEGTEGREGTLMTAA